jgi:hypothetical protein
MAKSGFCQTTDNTKPTPAHELRSVHQSCIIILSDEPAKPLRGSPFGSSPNWDVAHFFFSKAEGGVRPQRKWDKRGNLLRDTFQDYTLTGVCALCRRLCCKVRLLISSLLLSTSFCLPKKTSAGVMLSNAS